jgi:hypothetical protein
MEKGTAVGATDYITKFDAKMLAEKLAHSISGIQPACAEGRIRTDFMSRRPDRDP